MGYHGPLQRLVLLPPFYKDNMPLEKPGTALPPSPAPTCSLNLSRFRKKAGVSLEQIADSTKISLRFLRAIEAEEFEKLPGGIFSTSYLRQYAAAISYDEAELLGHFDRKMNPQPVLQAPERDRGSRKFLGRWLRIPAQAQR
jgi:transcriptional regulator with XRE-family HTH domain